MRANEKNRSAKSFTFSNLKKKFFSVEYRKALNIFFSDIGFKRIFSRSVLFASNF